MFIEVESKKGNRYLFDALSNDIYSLDSTFFINQNDTRDSLNLPNIQRNIGIDELTPSKIEGSAKTLIIELTEQCNLRCTYCVFDESYSKERSHSTKKIDIDLAKRRIKEFHHRAKQDAYIIFYGGEPLLEFDSIVNLTEYAKSIFGDRVKFSFTTNGMALTRNKYDFLINHDFLITVSLDGFKSNHDKSRLTIKGNPSWDRIMVNLEKLKEYNPEYYDEKIIFNNVINGIQDASSIDDEFNNNNLLKGKISRYSFILQNSIEENIKYNKFNELNASDIEGFFLDKNLNDHPLYKDRLLPLVKKIAFRVIGEKAQEGKKTCIPFVNRTYIRSNGDMQFCERISSFGKISDDKNLIEESQKIQEEFYENKKSTCLECYAYNFCELCPASFYYEGKFNDRHLEICNNFRNEFKFALQLYVELQENNVKISEL